MIAILAIAVSSCKKEGFTALTDERPGIPVLVTNATEFRPGPTITVSRASPAFSISLEIPAASGRTIKEISKVVATAGSSQPLFGTAGLYNTAPVTGNSNKVTFSSSLAEYMARTSRPVPANNPPVNAVELDRQFYFLLTTKNIKNWKGEIL